MLPAPGGSLALSGYFLIDRGGIVRWRFVEAIASLSDYGQYPNAYGIHTFRETFFFQCIGGWRGPVFCTDRPCAWRRRPKGDLQ